MADIITSPKVVVEFKPGMSPSNDALWYKLLFAVAVLIIGVIVLLIGIEYFKYGYDRELVVVEKSIETAAYDLFDRQFTHLLSTVSVLFAVFGLIIPFAAYLIQRETLRDERSRMMSDIAAHEQQLLERIESLKSEINHESFKRAGELESSMKKIAAQVAKFSEDRDAFDRELAYRLGMHFFLSGNAFPDNTLSKVMSMLYALDQFCQYPDYPKSTKWIDATLANILDIVISHDKNRMLGVHWSYRLEALKILRRVSGLTWLKPSLRDAARDLAKNILKIPPTKAN